MSCHADLHNYIHALHNVGYPVICRRCTCTVSPWNFFARSYVRTYIPAVYAYLTRAKCSHGTKGRPLVNHEGPRVQFYEAFSVPVPNVADLCLRETLLSLHSRYAASLLRREITGGKTVSEIRSRRNLGKYDVTSSAIVTLRRHRIKKTCRIFSHKGQMWWRQDARERLYVNGLDSYSSIRSPCTGVSNI